MTDTIIFASLVPVLEEHIKVVNRITDLEHNTNN